MTTRAIFENPGEPRLVYLARVLVAYMDEDGRPSDGLIHYDGADCDGQCLAEDIQNAVYALPDLNELEKAVAFFDATVVTGELQIEALIKAARKVAR